jgi:hypothetical protein
LVNTKEAATSIGRDIASFDNCRLSLASPASFHR